MENTRFKELTESAIKDCQQLRRWVIRNDSRNDKLLSLVGEIEQLIVNIKPN